MMNKNKYRIRSGERGVALIFALGILALLMIMMVAFVSSMLLQYQSSSNMSRMLDADLLADSAMNRALGIMNMLVADVNAAPTDPDLVRNFNRVVSLAAAGSVNKGGSAADDLEISYSSSTSTDYLYKYAATTMDEPYWIYVRSNNAGDNPKDTDPIIGRFAFAAIPNFRPRMNFNAIWGLPAYDGRIGADYREVATGLLTGVSVTEPDTSETLIDDLSRILNLADVADCLKQYYKSKDIELNTADDVSNLETDLSKFFSAGVKGQEVYLGTNGTQDTYYLRLNLAKIKERAEAAGDPTARVALFYDDTKGQTIPSSGGGVTKLNPFLNKFTDADKGTFSDVKYLKQQIVANIIDFAMPAETTVVPKTSVPVTSDVDPATWGFTTATIPKYTGNKKTCYINEIGIVAHINTSVTGTAGEYTATATIEYEPVIEIIDIYGGKTVTTYSVVVDADVSCNVSITGGVSPVNYEDSKNLNTLAITPSSDVASGWTYATTTGYYVGAAKTTPAEITAKSATNSFYLNIDELKIALNGAKLSIDGRYVDFVNLMPTGTGWQFDYTNGFDISTGTTAEKSFQLSGDQDFYFSCFLEANDPRQNLNRGDWFATLSDGGRVTFPYASGTAGTAATGKIMYGDPHSPESTGVNYHVSIGRVNNTVVSALKNMGASASDVDPEPSAVDIANGVLSTAYIKEANYASIWELGAVHRGIAWQTLNLKKANRAANGYTNCGGAYGDGDAEIADFVHVAPEITIPNPDGGTTTSDANQYPINFDINARPISSGASAPAGGSDDLVPWTQMFKGVEISGDYSGLTAGAAVTADSILDNVYSKTFYYRTIPFSYRAMPFARRGDIAEAISTATETALAGSNDAQLESVFGKVANLIDAKNDFPLTTRIVVAAEIINDIGGAADQSIKLKSFDDDGKEMEADCKIGQFDDGFDQVVARRKMLVTVQYRRNATTDKLIVTDIQDIE